MTGMLISRRSIATQLGALATVGPILARAAHPDANARPDEGLTHTAAAIHQEVSFGTPPERVYRALTDTAQFEAITRLSDAADLLTAPNAKPVLIEPHVGGIFTLFGGYVTGLQVEMVPNQRLVQVWQAGSWSPGEYSIVRFLLEKNHNGTKLVFDHRGFPDGQGPSLAFGWRVHYWEPMAKFLAQRHAP